MPTPTENFLEEFNNLPEVIERDRLYREASYIQRKLPPFGNPHQLNDEEKKLWDRYIEISDQITQLNTIIMNKSDILLRKYILL